MSFDSVLSPKSGLEEECPSPLIAKPKRVRVSQPRRPRTFPANIRQKLAQLGHAPPGDDTTKANMSVLIDKLSTDLKNYRLASDHWQKKYNDLKRTIEAGEASSNPVQLRYAVVEDCSSFPRPVCRSTSESPSYTLSACSSEDNQDPSTPTSPMSLIMDLQYGNSITPQNIEDYSAFGAHMLGRLQSTANPSLSLVHIRPPNLRSEVGLVGDSTFQAVLSAIDVMATLHRGPSTKDNPLPRVRHLKPDFDPEKARETWYHVFAPIDVSPDRFMFLAASASRRQIEYDEADPDYDHMDRVLAKATDLEVIDMLQYCGMLVAGMHQAVFQDSSLLNARVHLGRACERLLREAIFSRNLTTNPIVAQALLDGIVGTFGHFSTQSMLLAVVSILELSWQIHTQHPNTIHPSLQVCMAFFSLVLTPSPSKRATWMQRNMEVLQSPANQKYFQVQVFGYFGAAYYALLTQDEGALLSYMALLDEILAPGPHREEALEAWDVVNFHPIAPITTPSPSTERHPKKTASTPIYDHSSLYPSSFDPIFDLLSAPEVEFASWMASSGEVPPSHSSLSEDAPEPLFLDEYGNEYTPGENLKSLLRITAQLTRAEASLLFADHETCRYWVDEAEKTLLSIPVNFMFQRVLLMKNVIKTTCVFPTGTRTVVDEFERRMIQHDCAALQCPYEEDHVGGLCRTP